MSILSDLCRNAATSPQAPHTPASQPKFSFQPRSSQISWNSLLQSSSEPEKPNLGMGLLRWCTLDWYLLCTLGPGQSLLNIHECYLENPFSPDLSCKSLANKWWLSTQRLSVAPEFICPNGAWTSPQRTSSISVAARFWWLLPSGSLRVEATVGCFCHTKTLATQSCWASLAAK